MRTLATLSLLTLMSGRAALASFELMYIPSPNDSRVYRYDPVNRMRLGGFNASGVRYVHGGNEELAMVGIQGFPYRVSLWSGINEGFAQWAGDVTGYDRLSGRSVRTNVSDFNLYNLATGATSNSTLIGASAVRALPIDATRNGAWSFAGGSLSFRIHNSTGNLVTSATLAAGLTVNQWSNMIVTRNVQGGWMSAIVARTSAGNVLYRIRFDAFSAGLIFGSEALPTFSSAHNLALAPSHAGFYVVGADAATPTTVTRFRQYDNDALGFFLDSWTENIPTAWTTNTPGVGIVVAPEPGTLAALGLGAVALLRRRRRKSG